MRWRIDEQNKLAPVLRPMWRFSPSRYCLGDSAPLVPAFHMQQETNGANIGGIANHCSFLAKPVLACNMLMDARSCRGGKPTIKKNQQNMLKRPFATGRECLTTAGWLLAIRVCWIPRCTGDTGRTTLGNKLLLSGGCELDGMWYRNCYVWRYRQHRSHHTLLVAMTWSIGFALLADAAIAAKSALLLAQAARRYSGIFR